ncbi:MAG: hypothetical protein LR005_00895 [Candidatus Pacebacteria bacterium]|nr:hypothetical protein [Candidatus Paceibacterota bacterium]
MNEKVLWKIEELWKKYYSLSLQGVKQSHYWHSDLKERISFLYKNNISIYNPDFQRVIEFDFTQSKKPVHSDDYGEYLGLEKSQVLEKNSKLIYLFDNHNKIIQPFLEYAEIRGKSFDVVHIDAHADDAIYPFESPKSLDLRNTTNYIKQTRISDFFDFMSNVVIPTKAGIQSLQKDTLDSLFQANDNSGICDCELTKQSPLLIKNIHRYTKSIDFKEFKKPKNPYILSLDIDIFGPEGDFTDLESKVKIIAQAWKCADVVCIAMSPGFIDQKYAQEIIEILM